MGPYFLCIRFEFVHVLFALTYREIMYTFSSQRRHCLLGPGEVKVLDRVGARV